MSAAKPKKETALPLIRSADQRIAAAPQASVWVSANAGSGKTGVLVDRVVRLLLGGTRPERILCLTFTKAAAAEMANRLHRMLGAWVRLDDEDLKAALHALLEHEVKTQELAPARRLFAETLDAPGGLKIQTIHAFCQSLLGRFPLEADLSPHFTAMDERSSAELLDEARLQILARAHDGDHPQLADALDHVVALCDEARFSRVLKELAYQRGRLTRLQSKDGLARAEKDVRRVLGLGEGETNDSILAAACQIGAFDELGLTSAAEALETGTDKDKGRAGTIRKWLKKPSDRVSMLGGEYIDLFLTKAGEPRKESGLITKKPKEANPAALDVLLIEQQRIMELFERLKAVAVAEASRSLLVIAQALIGRYQFLKERRALLDYDDLILKARGLLDTKDGISWVHYKLDGGIEHILVDEAQDTSPDQWAVIEALTEEFYAGMGTREGLAPRSFFAVGDEKQSIYSFQGADLAMFERVRAHFAERTQAAGLEWRPVELAQSFRTVPVLLKTVDGVFANDKARDGVSLKGAEIRHRPTRIGQAGLVELWPIVKAAEKPEVLPWDAPLDQTPVDSPENRLAERIASTIKGWIENEEILSSRNRPIRPGDILILVGRRGSFVEEMVRRLKEKGIAVAGTDRMVLTEQIAVMDLVALGNFLLLPDDDLTLAEVLKGPLFGFDEEDLFSLCHERAERLWPELRKRRMETPRFTLAVDELEALLASVDYAPPFELFSALLGPGGGRNRLTARLGFEANDPLDEFLSLALEYERAHTPSLQGFLHWLAAGGTTVKRDLEQFRDEVRVMTIHGAKGLESNIVFLPDTCRVPDAKQESGLLWESGDVGEDGPPPPPLWPVRKANEEAACARRRDEAQRLREEEYRRLLYVALTRARDRLYICGWETQKGRGDGCWYDLVAAPLKELACEVEMFGESGWRLESAQEAPPIADKIVAGLTQAPEVLPQWARQEAPVEAVPPRPLAPSRPQEVEPASLSPLAGTDRGARFKRGRLIHRLLESLPELAQKDRASACRRYLSRAVHRLDDADRAEIAAETLAVLADPAFAALFGPGSLAEVRVAGQAGNTVISGQVDRLCVTPDEVLVVDYKTNRPRPEKVPDVPLIYLRQMAAYRAALQGIYPDKPVCCVLLWTDGPVLMALPDALLDAHAP